MFVPATYTCNDKEAVLLFHAQFGVSRLRSVEAAAVVEVADINKGKFTQIINLQYLS
jgi:hypothetical protein